QLLDEIVLFVVERRPSEVGEAERAVDLPTVAVGVLPARLAGGDDPVGDHVHGLLEIELLPLGTVGPAVEDLGEPSGLLDELARGGALRAQRALIDRRARVALDVDELTAARVHELATADGAEGTHRFSDLQSGDPG